MCLQTHWGILDFLGEVSGVRTFADAPRLTDIMDVEGVPTKVPNIDDLIRAKAAAGRPKEMRSVNDLTIIKQRTGRILFD